MYSNGADPDESTRGNAHNCLSQWPFVDLCLGPHVPNTSMIKAMKVYKHSATYWMGDAEADSLQRVYGVSFPDKKALKMGGRYGVAKKK